MRIIRRKIRKKKKRTEPFALGCYKVIKELLDEYKQLNEDEIARKKILKGRIDLYLRIVKSRLEKNICSEERLVSMLLMRKVNNLS